MIILATILIAIGIVGIFLLTSPISLAIPWFIQAALLFLILLLVVGVLMLLVKIEKGLEEKTPETIIEHNEIR